MALSPVIGIDESKCVNCHSCIAVCPVKFCINGSGDKVTIDHSRCIGCGSCVQACTHQARFIIDDWEAFTAGRRRLEKIVAIVAPSAAAAFPGDLLRLNGFLESLGVSACFDVSFGAELTILSYLNHMRTARPATLIAQPCPAVVSYIELYRPELLPFLAPADSPMLHTIKMIREYYPQYAGYRIAAVSPCIAKKREFEATGLGDYNITFTSLKRHMQSAGLSLASFPEKPYLSPPAERAAAFSTPGGLLGTLRREAPEIAERVRKIEGVGELYPYLDTLARSVELEVQPPLVDCLNCAKGCNGGTGTGLHEEAADLLDGAVAGRVREARAKLGTASSDRAGKRKMARILKKYWKPGLYERKYADRSREAKLRIPAESEKQEIFRRMNKHSEKDVYNCSSCGYQSCEKMAIAIHNGLNKPENCHHYMSSLMEQARARGQAASTQLHEKIRQSSEIVGVTEGKIRLLSGGADDQVASLEESFAAIEQMIQNIRKTSAVSRESRKSVETVMSETMKETAALKQTVGSILELEQSIRTITEMISVIDKVAADTNLLAMNAAIEAAHAGDAGRGFSVVAGEIKRLAETSGQSSKKISGTLKEMVRKISDTAEQSQGTAKGLLGMVDRIRETAETFGEVSQSLAEISVGTEQITATLERTGRNSRTVRDFCVDMLSAVNRMSGMMGEVVAISNENVSLLSGSLK